MVKLVEWVTVYLAWAPRATANAATLASSSQVPDDLPWRAETCGRVRTDLTGPTIVALVSICCRRWGMSETKTAPHAAAETRVVRVARLRMASLGVVVMLILQFILGMIYNLYGTAPTTKKPIGLFSTPVIALHVILGILIGLAAIVLLVRAIGARHKLSIWVSAIGLLAILGAGFAGLGFTGSGDNSASLSMSLGFAVALACYIVLVFALAPSGPAPSGQASTT